MSDTKFIVVMAAVVLAWAEPMAAQLPRTSAPQGSNGAAAAPQGAARGANGGTERREDWQRVADIFSAVGAIPGSRIADVGAGEGWLTTRLARQVGPTGRVFAVDISEGSLGQLAETLAKDSLRNVEVILSEADDPRLPYGTLDGVVIVNAYHEMTQRVAMLDGIKRALRPGGLLVIADSPPADTAFVTRRDQTQRHSLALDFARDDLEAQGFEIVSTDTAFVSNKHDNHSHRQWLLVARRGKK